MASARVGRRERRVTLATGIALLALVVALALAIYWLIELIDDDEQLGDPINLGVTLSQLVANPSAYVEDRVSVTGAVDESYEDGAFQLGADTVPPDGILVVQTGATEEFEEGEGVRVVGVVLETSDDDVPLIEPDIVEDQECVLVASEVLRE